jgi:hypothetical protein
LIRPDEVREGLNNSLGGALFGGRLSSYGISQEIAKNF